MRKKERKILGKMKLSLLMVGVLNYLILPLAVLAVGTTPSVIIVNGLRRDNQVAKTVNLTIGQQTADSYFSVTAYGEGARYLELPLKEITVPKDSVSYAYTFYIKPATAASGSYTATIFFIPKKMASSASSASSTKNGAIGASVSLVVGATARVDFTVTDKEIKKLTVHSIDFPDTEVEMPVSLNFLAVNNGNVDVRPDKVEVEIVDTTDIKLAYKEEVKSEKIALVAVATRQQVNLVLTTKLPQGKYMASTTFWFANQPLYQKSNLIFHVYPPGTLAQTANFTSFSLNADKFTIGDLVKISGRIDNTGKAIIKPIFYVEIKKDDKILELLKSEEKTLFKGANSEYTITYRPQTGGRYKAEGYFEFGVHKTEKKTKDFVVGGLMAGNKVYVYVTVVLLAAAALAIWLIRRRLKMKNKLKSDKEIV